MSTSLSFAICTNIIDALYKPAFSQLYTKIGKIVQTCANYASDAHDHTQIRYLVHNGEIFFTKNMPNYADRQRAYWAKNVPDKQVPIHDSQYEPLMELIEERKQLLSEQQSSEAFIRTLVNLCTTQGDILLLLPNVANEAMMNSGIYHITLTNTKTTLTEDVVRTFLQDNQTEIDTIKERAFLNLLTRG